MASLLVVSNYPTEKIDMIVEHPFRYSDNWTGTALPLLNLNEAVQLGSSNERWPMGRWPDPILRRKAEDVTLEQFGTNNLKLACEYLRNTAIAEKAVGLAAQQCGVNARIIYLDLGRKNYLTMINPRIRQRSPETDMKVWRENCLVLPPKFQATVLRDAWIDVQYQDIEGLWQNIRFRGEVARAMQHESDHDRGILVTDHVSLDELENDTMRAIERQDHDQRMMLAYARYCDEEVAA